MKPRNTATTIAFTAAILLLGGCGLATTDEERLDRATAQIADGAYRSAMIEIKNVLGSDPENVRARLMLAEVSLGLGDVETATKEMTRAAELNAPASTIRPLHLRILLAKGQHTETLAALAEEPEGLSETQALDFRGRALLGLQNANAARETYEQWLAIEPGSVDARVGLARAVAMAGARDEAVAQLQAIVRDHPEHVDALQGLGLLHFEAGNFADAEPLFQAAYDHNVAQRDIARHVRILTALIESQLAQGKTEDARATIGALARIVPQSPVTLFLSARLARMEQDYALSARFLQTLLNISPDHPQAQLALANVQMIQGNYAQAEVLLNRVVSLSPDNYQARKLLAQVQLRQAQPQGAVEALAPLVEAAEEDLDVYTLLAEAGLQQGDSRSVIENLRAAAELAPDDIDLRLNLAAAYLGIGESALAAEVLQGIPDQPESGFKREELQLAVYRASGATARAESHAASLLSRFPGNAEAVLVVARHYVESGNRGRARDVLAEFLQRNPGSVDANLALARLHLSDGDLERARQRFEIAQDAEPRNAFARLGLVRIAELGGDTELAMSLLQAAVRDDGDAVVPRVWLADRYLRAGQARQAELLVNDLVAAGLNDPTVALVSGRVLAEVGRLEEAIIQLERAVTLDPASAPAHLNAARTYLALSRTVEARESLDRLLELQPGSIPAKTLLALVELRQGRADAAIRHVSELRSAHPDNAAVMVLEGELYLYQDDFQRAAAAFNRAVQNGAGQRAVLREFQARANGQLPNPDTVLTSWLAGNADDLVVRTMLAQYYLQTRSAQNAIREFETILRSQPDNAPILNNLAWQYQQIGELDKAVQAAERAYALDSESGSIADTLGWIYRDLGQLDKSRELLRDATRLAPDNSEIKYHLAAVLAESGNAGQARSLLQELVTNNAQFPSRRAAEELLQTL